VKNVAYVFALAAGLLTMSGCYDRFCSSKKAESAPAQAKPLAENEVATEAVTAEAAAEATVVASTEGAVEAAEAVVEEKAESTVVASAAMPMNEVASEQKVA